MTRKRERSPTEDSDSEVSGATFNYETVQTKPPPPEYICYPNNPAWAMPQFMPAPAYNGYPAAAFQPAGYQQYYCYPHGFPAADACAGAALRARTPTAPAASASEPKPSGKTGKVWLGRTKAQVREDNIKMAVRENVYKNDPMKPVGPSVDQLFWVVELDGSTVLYNFKTIDEALGAGRWERDPRFGNAIFIREEPKKE